MNKRRVSIKFFTPRKLKRVVEGSGWEVKQNNGKRIYLSSNDSQIKAHITNLDAKQVLLLRCRSSN